MFFTSAWELSLLKFNAPLESSLDGLSFDTKTRSIQQIMGELLPNICDPFWDNLPIRTDNFFSDLLIKA